MPRIVADTPEKKSRFHAAVERKVRELTHIQPEEAGLASRRRRRSKAYHPTATDGHNLDAIASMLPTASSPLPIDFDTIDRKMEQAGETPATGISPKAAHGKVEFPTAEARDFVHDTLVTILAEEVRPARVPSRSRHSAASSRQR